jgi:hypothetical protein
VVRLLLILITALCLHPALAQQPLRINWTSIADGQAGVPRQDSLIVEFDRTLAFLTQFSRVLIEPRSAVFRSYSFYDGGRRMTFTLRHAANTDFSIVAYGIRGRDGARLARPHVVNYSTALTTGSIAISGVVRYSDSRVVSPPQSVVEMAASLLRRVDDPAKHSTVVSTTWPVGESPFIRPTHSAAFEPERTVVFLVDRFEMDPMKWITRSAAAVDNAGAFVLQNVRPGNYYPLAMSYGDPDGQTVSAFGFLDAGGLLSPSSVLVNEDLGGLNLTSYALFSATALDGLPIAAARTGVDLPDASLVEVRSPHVAVDGTSTLWIYSFQDSAGRELTVRMNPIFLETEVSVGPPRLSVATFELLDSPAIVEMAERSGGSSFRGRFLPTEVSLGISLAMMTTAQSPVPQSVWTVAYDAGNETLAFHYDAYTGESVTPGSSVSTPAPGVGDIDIGPPFPNPASGRVSFPIVLDAPGRITIQAYDAIGRSAGSLFDGQRPAGLHDIEVDVSTLSTGAWMIRIRIGDRHISRPLLIVR